MGINCQSLKAILAENQYKPIRGTVLLIGKSTVTVSRPKLEQLLVDYLGTSPCFVESYTQTKNATIGDYDVDDRELLYKIAPDIEKIDVLDVSDYEGANVICDLNKTVPRDLWNNYDFIYDSSVLDNVFNPTSLIVNVASMLKPGGRYLGINVTSFFPGSMVAVHPEWLYGFFAVNKFKDCKVYVAAQSGPGTNRFEFDTNLWLYRPQYTKSKNYNYYEAVKNTNQPCYLIAVAEKNDLETKNQEEFIFPTNLQYIDSSEVPDWASSDYHRFDSNRPLMKGIFLEGELYPDPPHLTDHYLYLGSQF